MANFNDWALRSSLGGSGDPPQGPRMPPVGPSPVGPRRLGGMPSASPTGQPAVCRQVVGLNAACAVLTDSVGPRQPNKMTDVRMVQTLINIAVTCGYLDSVVLGGNPRALGTPLAVTGNWTPQTQAAVTQIERLYFHGRANPHGIGVIDPQADESMFTFLVNVASGSQKAKAQLSVQMRALADVMVPGGALRKGPDGLTPIETYLPGILDELTKRNLNDTDMVLMALATIAAECSSFVPTLEPVYDYNTPGKYTDKATGEQTWDSAVQPPRTDKAAVEAWESRLRMHHNLQAGKSAKEKWTQDGPAGEIYQWKNSSNDWMYRGRGFIQLTGEANYNDASEGLNLGKILVTNPDLANKPEYAGAILALYLKRREPKIREYLRGKTLMAQEYP